MLASSNRIVFQIFSWLGWLTYYLFIFGIGFSIMRLIFIGGLALYQPHHHQKNLLVMDGYYPLVTVVVAAFNEGKVICNTIRSLLNSDYCNLDVIIVDDGSKDPIYYKLLREFEDADLTLMPIVKTTISQGRFPSASAITIRLSPNF